MTSAITTVKDLGNAIREARSAMKLRQAEAALLCGVGVRFLSDLERGKETVRMGPALKVIQGLGLALTVAPKKPFWSQDGGGGA
jgi:HTH-type transcriptional regulator/antitoxin HipB